MCLCTHMHVHVPTHAHGAHTNAPLAHSYMRTGVNTHIHTLTCTQPRSRAHMHPHTCTHVYPLPPDTARASTASSPWGRGDARTGQHRAAEHRGGTGFPSAPGRCPLHPGERGPLLAPIPRQSRASSGASQQQTVKGIIRAQRKLFS